MHWFLIFNTVFLILVFTILTGLALRFPVCTQLRSWLMIVSTLAFFVLTAVYIHDVYFIPVEPGIGRSVTTVMALLANTDGHFEATNVQMRGIWSGGWLIVFSAALFVVSLVLNHQKRKKISSSDIPSTAQR